MTPKEAIAGAALGSWGAAWAGLSREALITTDLQFRITSWPLAAESLLGWPQSRAIGFGLGSVLNLSSSTMSGLREFLERHGRLNDVLLPARRSGGMRCLLRANAEVVRNTAEGEPLGIAFALVADDDGNGILPESLPGWIGHVLDLLELPIVVADSVGTVRYANHAGKTLFGVAVGTGCCAGLCDEAVGGCRTTRVLGTATPSYWEIQRGPQRLDVTATPVALSKTAHPDHVMYIGVPAQPHLSPELRKFFRAVDENLAGVFITDRYGMIEYVNPQVSEILGYSPLELISRDIRKLVEADAVVATPIDQEPLRSRSFETTMTHRCGIPRPVRIALSEIRGEDGEISNWVMLCEDISARRDLEERERQLQEQVAHSARLAAVGEIASMIAHEINQPLSTISNFGGGMLRRLRDGKLDPESLIDALEEIVAQVDRAGEIVRNVRGLARRRQAELKQVNVEQLVRTLLPTFQMLGKPGDVKVDMEVGRDLPAVGADAVQLEQVLINLVRNAIEASAALPRTRRRVRVLVSTMGDGVRVAVQDHGPLPDPSISSRIGEPFFTTKAGGLGLGLAISRTLLENHGSRLNMEPVSGGGKSFQFDLVLIP